MTKNIKKHTNNTNNASNFFDLHSLLCMQQELMGNKGKERNLKSLELERLELEKSSNALIKKGNCPSPVMEMKIGELK